MFIIGTAGHVDHGKTLLIKALTGIDTDRLPEEKARGLTIDLGFAHFPDERGKEIGVVDVPGHERFIRNMTAGAWGIDLALLVIAADDGWMYQTGNHLSVLSSMGIDEIIIVVTKIDIAEPGRAEDIIADAEVRVYEQTSLAPSSVSVSALTGEGIENLREMIISRLNSIDEKRNKTHGGHAASVPLMYIDRAFGIRGAGLVVTGSLREGPVSKNDSLLLLPAGKTVRVRGVQTYDSETETAVPACRTALNLSGIDADAVSRGCCLTAADSGFSAETEVILRLSGSESAVRNHSEAEFAAGTAHTIGSIHFLKTPDSEESGAAACARVSLDEPLTLRFGQPVVIIRKGGSRITGSGRVIWKGTSSREERQSLVDAVISGQADEEVGVMLAVKGFCKTAEGWKFSKEAEKKLQGQVIEAASAAGGVRREELTGRLGLPAAAVDALLDSMRSENLIFSRDGTFFKSDGKNGSDQPGKSPSGTLQLNRNAQLLVKAAAEAGKTGLDLKTVSIPGAKNELRTLTRAELIVPVSENIFYTKETYREVSASILKGLSPGARFDIALAKDRTGLSRKYIIPLLNKMEEHGLVAREDNLRRVLKTELPE